MSTAVHPQTDGQAERNNAILEQYLSAYFNYQQDNWAEILLLAEFAYNNSKQETIKHTPFFANYGYHLTYELIGHLTPQENMNLSQLHEKLREEITLAQLRLKENYDRHRKPDPNLKSGDKVWLNAKNIRTARPNKKLDNKKAGPFTILAKVGKSSYKLELPPSMNIHSTFHISLVEPYSNNPLPSQRKEPPLPVETEGEPEYELDEIVDSRLYCGSQLQYRAKWTGYPPEHDKFSTQPVTLRMPASQSNDFIKVILTNHDGITKIETENASTLPTQEEVRKEEEEWKTSIEAARKKENDHAGKS